MVSRQFRARLVRTRVYFSPFSFDIVHGFLTSTRRFSFQDDFKFILPFSSYWWKNYIRNRVVHPDYFFVNTVSGIFGTNVTYFYFRLVCVLFSVSSLFITTFPLMLVASWKWRRNLAKKKCDRGHFPFHDGEFPGCPIEQKRYGPEPYQEILNNKKCVEMVWTDFQFIRPLIQKRVSP
jgi:hypothetical protein